MTKDEYTSIVDFWGGLTHCKILIKRLNNPNLSEAIKRDIEEKYCMNNIIKAVEFLEGE